MSTKQVIHEILIIWKHMTECEYNKISVYSTIILYQTNIIISV